MINTIISLCFFFLIVYVLNKNSCLKYISILVWDLWPRYYCVVNELSDTVGRTTEANGLIKRHII